jgi:RNA polymerase sigma factor (sigma-70 family)
MDETDLQVFEDARSNLLGLAYRMLGSRADSEDVVQDCFVKWREADRATIRTPQAWLAGVCTNRCLDVLRAAARTRVDYVGPWLPEPVQTAQAHADDKSMAASLTIAFLLMLERLTPKERAAYLLHEVFDHPYAEIATILDIDEAACRKLASRARAHLAQEKPRHVTPLETQDRLLTAFQTAVLSGSTGELAAILSADIRVTTDSDGKAAAALRVLEGAEALSVLARAHLWWRPCVWTFANINGGRGAILTSAGGEPVLALSFACNELTQICDLNITRNPSKLRHLGGGALH